VDITSANPRSFDLGFSTWSLRVLAGFLIYDLKLIDKISHSAEIRNILLKHNIKWRKSKTVLSNKRSNDPEYSEKKYIEQLRYNTPKDSILLYLDEKGPITARTWWYILVIDTGKDREDSKDKRATKCIWCL
jgi:hypothetical protein